jgi:hypothetical protein
MAYGKKNGMTKAQKRAYWWGGTALVLGILAPVILPADWYAKLASRIGLEVN